jgi:hypothetical protein
MAQKSPIQNATISRTNEMRRAVEKWISGAALSDDEAELVDWAMCSSLARALDLPA